MSIGIKIYHVNPAYRNCVVTIEIPQIMLAQAKLCPTCNIIHTKKTYHLRLDDSAGTIVSQEAFKHLKQAGLPNLAVESEVSNPPAATLDMGGSAPPRIVVEKPKIQIRTIGV